MRRRTIRRTSMLAAALALAVTACGDGGASRAAAPAAEVELLVNTPDRVVARVGESFALWLISVDAIGGRRTVPGEWESSNRAVATVDTLGHVRAVGVGEATITGRHGARARAVTVTSTPAGLLVVVHGARGVVAPDSVYDVTATFVDVRGEAIEVGWPIDWWVSDSTVASVSAVGNSAEGLAQLRVHTLGAFTLTAQTDARRAYVASTSLQSRTRNALLEVSTFRVLVSSSPGSDRWLFSPDLVVIANEDVVVTRIDFGAAAACGTASVGLGAETPLFDFQPYNFSWLGDPPPAGTEMRAELSLQYPDGRIATQFVSGPLVVADRSSLLDRGTDGFPWTKC